MLKLTPMILFLVLLIVLVISIVIGRTSLNEGFIAFQYSKQPADLVSVTCYSTTKQVTKIEDSIYFDQANGNLIELDGLPNGTTADSTGTTLTTMLVLPRVGNEMYGYALDTSNGTVPVVQDTNSSKIATLASSYSSRVYTTVGKNSEKATILYIPWKQDTYIIPILTVTGTGKGATTGTIINATTISNMYHFSSGNNVEPAAITSSASLTGFYADTDASNNTMVIENVYDASRSIYQISHYVKFDVKNANLIIKNSDNTITIYDRYKSHVTGLTSATNTTTVPNTGFSPWTVIDGSGQTIVMYIANGTNTVVVLAAFSDDTLTKLTLNNVVRFTSSGPEKSADASASASADSSNSKCDLVNNTYYTSDTCVKGGYNWDYTGSGFCTKGTPLQPSPTGTAVTPVTAGTAGTTVTAGTAGTTVTAGTAGTKGTKGSTGSGGLDLSKFDDNAISDYFKWYWYWKSGAGSPGTDTSDYILKTQIVPPVCPASASCPSCQNSSSGTCTNCGGKGGSGTVTSSGTSIFDICGNPTTCAKLGPNGIGYDASKNKIMCYNNGGTGTGTSAGTNTNGQGNYGSNSAGGVANNAISTTGNIIGGAASGAGAIVGGTALGAGLLAEKAIDTTGGLLTGAGTGASNLLTGAGRGISNILTPGQNGGQGVGQGTGQGTGYGGAGGAGNNQRSTYYGTQNQYSDQYSYYGQLPSKTGSNYMPITTDFSAFSK